MRRYLLIPFLVIGLLCEAQESKTLKEIDSISEQSKAPLPLLAKSVKFPVYKGCHKIEDNKETRDCSIQKIKDFIKMSYDLAVADRALPLERSTQFQLDFIVNKKGKVEKVTAKANHRAIAIEAIKTAKRLPKFKTPGMLNGSPVDTPMTLTMILYF